MLSVDEFLDSSLGESASSQAALVKKDNYRHNYRFINITSYSQREVLHRCSREFQQLKIIRPGIGLVDASILNLDFIFGHAVAAGVQTYIVTGSRSAALFAAFLSWTTDLDNEKERGEKSAYFAILAVLKFIDEWDKVKAEWEVASFSGRPASELSFWLDCENGYYHVGHIDVVLRNKRTGYYTVIEIKTTSMRDPDEAQYGNSEQALGYSIILDTIVGSGLATFQVLYFIYSTMRRGWTPFPFVKARKARAEWLQDLLLDHTTINTYRQLGFFPKRGNSCWTFSRRCPHYGVCDLHTNTVTDKFDVWTPDQNYPEQPDFIFKLSEVAKEILEEKKV